MADARVNATFTATDKATPVIKTLRANIKEMGSKTGGPLGGLLGGISSLSPASVVAGAGIGALTALVADSVGKFKESQAIQAQTVAVLQSTGGAAGVTADQVGNLAQAISDYSGQDDEAVQKGENLLLTFTNIKNAAGAGNDIFTQTTKVMADMAQAMGGDAASQAIVLGKALNDPVKGLTALTRVGVTFSNEQRTQIAAMVKSGKTMEAQKVILAELNKEFGGSAKAFGDTFAGKEAKIANAIGNLEEGLGGLVTGVLSDAIDGIDALASGLGNVGTAFNDLNRAINPGVRVAQDMDAAIRKQAEALGLDGDAAVAFYEKQQKATQVQQVAAQVTLGQAIAQEHLNNMSESYDAIATKFGVNVGDVTAAVLQYTDGTGKSTTATQDAVSITQAADGAVNQYAASIKGLSDAEAYHHHNDYLATDLKKTAEVFHHVGGEMNHTFNTVIKKAGAFPQSIHDQIVAGKGQVRAAMADIAWAMKHPFADDQYVAWLHHQIAKAERKKLIAQKRGDTATVAQITATIAAEQALIDSIHSKTVTVSVIGQNYGSSGRHWGQGGRAGGGPVRAGETYMVGEHGPELLHMGNGASSGYVTQGRGSGGGQPVIHTHVYIDGREIAVAVDRRMGMGWSAAGSSSTRN